MTTLPLNSSELTGEQALEIVRWLETNVTALHHSDTKLSAFWPHKNCEECCFWEKDGCSLHCRKYENLSLVEYVSMRRKEEK